MTKKPTKTTRFKAAKGEGLGVADRVNKSVSEHTKVYLHPVEDQARRDRLEADPPAWLKWYLKEAYSRPFEKPHLELIHGAVEASRTGGRFAVAGERGIGKSVILWGLVLFLKFKGEQPFPACVPWAAPALKRAFKFWKIALCFNARLDADYPEFCAPFKHSRGVPQKCMATTWYHNGEPTGAAMAVGEGVIIFPDSKGGIGGVTIGGNPRGLNLPLQDGRTIRPSIVLVDDVQDRKVASSQTQVADTIDIIDSDVGGMGDSVEDFPMLMAGNCIVDNDVMSHYLQSKNWKSIRVPCVEAWPVGWDEGAGETFKLWEEWFGMFDAKDNHEAFFTEHAETLTNGFVLSCPSSFDRDSGLNGFCAVMRKYFTMGKAAFYAEKQQAPIKKTSSLYYITPKTILSRTDEKRAVFQIPEWARAVTIAATDINHYGLHSGIGGFGSDESCAVLWHGCFEEISVPKNSTKAIIDSIVFKMLTAHGRQIKASTIRPALWIIDAGYSPDTVNRYITAGEGREMPFPVVAAKGFDQSHYRPYGRSLVGKPREQCHLSDFPTGRKIAWNSDHWGEISQRAWLGAIGEPGACSLYDGDHRDFAEQICREILIEKIEGDKGTYYNWERKPGKHDFKDVMAMMYMGAAFHSGIGPGGQVKPQRKARPRENTVIAL